MKLFTDQQVDDLIKLKFWQLVTDVNHKSYISNRILGKVFGVSGSKVRQLYLDRFEAMKAKDLKSFL